MIDVKKGRSFKKMFSSKKKKTGGKGGFRGLDGGAFAPRSRSLNFCAAFVLF